MIPRPMLLSAVLFAAAPLAACETQVDHADPVPAVDRLAGMLADESVINAIMGNTELHVYYKYRELPGWPDGDVYSRPECMPVTANAMEAGYHGRKYGQVRGARLADNRPGTPRSIDEAVVAFDSNAAAQALVSATVQTWQACANAMLTITSANRPTARWTMETPRVVDGVQVVDAADPDMTALGWRTSHAMRVAENVLIDVRVTDYGVSDQAARVANAIAGGNPL